MRTVADRDVCIGAGQCVLSEPCVFDQSDEDGRVLLLTDSPDDEFEEAVRTVVDVPVRRAVDRRGLIFAESKSHLLVNERHAQVQGVPGSRLSTRVGATK